MSPHHAHHAHHPDPQALASVKAAFALKGHALTTSHRADDGRITYLVTRWTHSRHFSNWQDVNSFLVQIGGTP